MTKRKRKNRSAEKVMREFREKMQQMVDEPNSGITGVSISAGGQTVDVAKRKRKDPPQS